MTTEDLVNDNLALIKHIAASFYNVPFEDLLQAGAMGILKAYKNYKNNGTTKFSTYAYDYIFGEMSDFVNKDRKIKVSKDMLRLAKQIEVTRNALSLKLGRIPDYEEVASFLELSPHQVMEAVECTREMISLDNNTKEVRDLHETIPAKEVMPLEEKLTLNDAIQNLSESEQKIIEYRYYEDLTQSETAKRLGMTQVMVSRYENKSLQALRSYYEVV